MNSDDILLVLRRLIEERGIKKQELAAHLNKTRQTLDNLLKGNTNLSLHLLCQITTFMEVKLSDVVRSAENKAENMKQPILTNEPEAVYLSKAYVDELENKYRSTQDALINCKDEVIRLLRDKKA